MASLDEIVAYIDDFVERHGIGAEPAFHIKLVIEELFTNALKYAPQSAEDVEIDLGRQNNHITVLFAEHGVEAFDITAHETGEVDKPLENRRAGGMGLELIRNITDSIDYEHRDGTSRITLTIKVPD